MDIGQPSRVFGPSPAQGPMSGTSTVPAFSFRLPPIDPSISRHNMAVITDASDRKTMLPQTAAFSSPARRQSIDCRQVIDVRVRHLARTSAGCVRLSPGGRRSDVSHPNYQISNPKIGNRKISNPKIGNRTPNRCTEGKITDGELSIAGRWALGGGH